MLLSMAAPSASAVLIVVLQLLAILLQGCGWTDIFFKKESCLDLVFPVHGHRMGGRVKGAPLGASPEVKCPPGFVYAGEGLECGMVSKICPTHSNKTADDRECYHEYEFVRPGTGLSNWPENRHPELQNSSEARDHHLLKLHFYKTSPRQVPTMRTTAAPEASNYEFEATSDELDGGEHELLIRSEKTTAREKAGELDEWSLVIASRERKRPVSTSAEVPVDRFEIPAIIRVDDLQCVELKPADRKYDVNGADFSSHYFSFRGFMGAASIGLTILMGMVWQKRSSRNIDGRRVISHVPKDSEDEEDMNGEEAGLLE